MTPPQQPEWEKHQMNCSTCDFRTSQETVQLGEFIEVDACHGMILSPHQIARINLVGCCSHSDMAHHDEQVRREERERVLTTILDSVSCEYQDERDSSEGGCPGSRNGERCDREECRYFKTDLSQLLTTI